MYWSKTGMRPHPPISTSHLPDVTYMMNVPRPSHFCRFSTSMYYLWTQSEEQKQGRPGNEASILSFQYPDYKQEFYKDMQRFTEFYSIQVHMVVLAVLCSHWATWTNLSSSLYSMYRVLQEVYAPTLMWSKQSDYTASLLKWKYADLLVAFRSSKIYSYLPLQGTGCTIPWTKQPSTSRHCQQSCWQETMEHTWSCVCHEVSNVATSEAVFMKTDFVHMHANVFSLVQRERERERERERMYHYCSISQKT